MALPIGDAMGFHGIAMVFDSTDCPLVCHDNRDGIDMKISSLFYGHANPKGNPN